MSLPQDQACCTIPSNQEILPTALARQNFNKPTSRRLVNNQERAEGSLFSTNAISQQLDNYLSCTIPRDHKLIPLSEELFILGYPTKSINSMLKCGQKTEYKYLRECNCKIEARYMTYRCNLRTCPVCSNTRKRKLRQKFIPFLNSLDVDRNNNQLYFLTISPKNYENFKWGLEHLQRSFIKFLKSKYIKDRIKGALYVLEAKNMGKGWNIHIHAIIYGRRLDNRLRGKCLNCGQNLLKFDYNSKDYYCANHKCNSKNVIIKKDSNLVSLFKKISGREVNINVQSQHTREFTLNYMLKYISANKDEFASLNILARYIYNTRKRKLINSIGIFNDKDLREKYLLKKPVYHCPDCNSIIKYTFDSSFSNLISKLESGPRHPPNLKNFGFSGNFYTWRNKRVMGY
ncbi:MAG: protein rep [Candidatus Nanoarchaeia archaeon]|nr:protein rep [Candidatus Nanoarchaeia archaeon]